MMVGVVALARSPHKPPQGAATRPPWLLLTPAATSLDTIAAVSTRRIGPRLAAVRGASHSNLLAINGPLAIAAYTRFD
jgi:hypothetical protein